MSRRIIRYRSPRARRLVSQAHLVLVASGILFTLTLAAWAGSALTLTTFHWVMAAVNAAFTLLSLLLYRLAARAGLDPATGRPDLVDMTPRPVPCWAPPAQAAPAEPVFRLPTIPAIPKPAAPPPVRYAPAQPANQPVTRPVPARTVPTAPVTAPVAPAAVEQAAELAAQP